MKRKKFWKRLTMFLIVIPVLLFSSVVTIAYLKQDEIVKDLIKTLNEDFVGTIRIKDSHVAPFANFPYISIDIEGLEIFEGKEVKKKYRIARIQDTYVGFNLMGMLGGKYDVKSIKLKDGDLRIVQHKDGSLNISNALASTKPIADVKDELHLDLKSIKLENIDVSKLNEANNIMVDAYITSAKSKLTSKSDHFYIALESKFELSLIKDGDTTFIKHKHFQIDTELDIDEKKKLFTIYPTEIELEKATFAFDGTMELKDDMALDFHFHGDKPDFNLFLALAPEELAPTLKKFENKGKIFFDATLKGKSINGHRPAIKARFGCEKGFFNNLESGKRLDKIGFKGTFTNGAKRNASTMRFELENFTAKPEAGVFSGKLVVENFESPDIDMNLVSDFDLDFLAKFINTEELKGLSGRVALTMNFHDIVDFENPEKSIERLNESYYSELVVENLKFKTSAFHVPLERMDMKVTLKGHKAQIEKLKIKAGKSDLFITGIISDLPAIIHHTNDPVMTDLEISSKYIDIKELTSGDKNIKPVDEQIENLSLKLEFLSSARAITESPNLPKGEFFISNLYAKMKHYPHVLHDFHADVFVDKADFRVVDFSGMIDKSDFHFSGKLENYNMWFDEKMSGDTKIEFDLTSKLLQFDNLFTYGGEKFVPEDYRHEEGRNMRIHGTTALHFDHGLKSTDFKLTQFEGSLKVHHLRLEQFSGRVYLENEHLSVKQFKGKLGHSNFVVDMEYELGKLSKGKHNSLTVKGTHLDIDELLNYNLGPPVASTSSGGTPHVNHDSGFSLYDLDFRNMDFHFDVGHVNYHHHMLDHFKADVRTEKNHVVHFDKFSFDAAGGHFDIKGYLSGKDKEHIYFKPDINIRNVDLDKFMIKFENFGQDHVVSENLHGKFTGHISGKLHLHADLVPKMDDSDLTINMTVLKGKLENYAPLLALSSYFEDKNMNKILFDTLKNTLTLKKGILKIPEMTINSSLGFLEIHGEQHINGKMQMNYLIGVPWKMISKIAGQKLFKNRSGQSESDDEIQYRQENSKFVYVSMIGDLEDYKVKLAKKPKRPK
ncbi:MAG: hypothetical protein RI883_360 [Bacteroidota bacterium]